MLGSFRAKLQPAGKHSIVIPINCSPAPLIFVRVRGMRAVVLGDKTGWIAHLPGPINRDLLPRLVTSLGPWGYCHKLRQFAARRAMPQKRNKTRENIERSRRATRLRLGLDTRMLIALFPVIVSELTMIMIAPQAQKVPSQGRQINGQCLRRRHRWCKIQS